MTGLSNFQKAIFALIIANIIWGATPPILKWALEDVPPFTLAFFRFFLASLILLPFLKHKKLKIQMHDWPKLFSLSFIGIFLHISFFLLGLELSSSINVPIIASAAPVFLTILSILLLKEHPKTKKLVGGVVSLSGVLLIVLLPLLGTTPAIDSSIIGNLFFIASTSLGIVHALALKSMSKKYNALNLLFWSFAIASLMFFPMFFNDLREGALANMGMQGVIGIAYGAIFSSLIAYFMLYWAMKYVMASEVGIFSYIDPVVTIVVAAPLLGEHPTPTYMIGAIFVFLGIYIAEGRLHYHPIHLLRR